MAIMAIVFWAFRASGGRKAGTPLLIASIPVKAVHPEAKVWSKRNGVTGIAALAGSGGN
jgi:hypothetical protein